MSVKKLFLLLLLLLAAALSVCAEDAVNPFLPVECGVAPAEAPTLVYRGVDFAGGASLLRFRAVSESTLTIHVYLDSTDAQPAATAVIRKVNRESRCKVDLSGVHDLILVLEGSGTLLSWQAFTSPEDIEAAIRAETGVVYDDRIPARYTAECQHGGTVEKFTYQAHDWFGDGSLYEKTAYVYLPFGYDPAQTCDLLILCHGIGGSETEWGLPAKDSRVKRIMDNLTDAGEIRPMIVVTPNGRAGHTSDYGSFYLFDQELRNDLLPALAQSYAVDTADRSRCAMAGLSMGGMQTINIGIGKCLDLFSAFGAFSAAPTSNSAAVTARTLNTRRDLPVRMFYSVCGTEDSVALASAKSAADGLDGMTDTLGRDNFQVQYIPGGHDFTVWYLGFYNFVKMIGK